MSVITLDDTDPAIHYGPIGNWQQSGGSVFEYNHTTTVVHEAGTASLNFTGVRIAVFGTIGGFGSNDSAPRTLFTLDGGDSVTFIGTQAAEYQPNQQFYNSPLLPGGGHNLAITNIQGSLSIDYFNITVSDPPSSSSSPVAGTTTAPQSTKTATQQTSSNSATPIAAIVGGSLGGLTIICLFAFAIIFARRRPNKSRFSVPLTENARWIPLDESPVVPLPNPLITPFAQPETAASTSNNHAPQIAYESGKGRRAAVLRPLGSIASSSTYSPAPSPAQPTDDPPPGYRDS